jgi:hypothetical protein
MSGINRAAERGHTGELPMVTCKWDSEEKCTVLEHYVDGVHLPRFATKREIGWGRYLVREFLKPERVRRIIQIYHNPRTGQPSYKPRYYEYEYSFEQIAAEEATPEWQKAKAKFDKKDMISKDGVIRRNYY